VKKDLLRIIDANANRSREGLRVCEEITRFILEDKALTKDFKNIRHAISRNVKSFPGEIKVLLISRESQTDIGTNILNPSKRETTKDLFLANIQRAKEALRVLEEFSSVFSRPLSKSFARLRFKTYALEKKAIARF
jgi:thiamine-phosphate pyrophosphorylase